MGSRKAILELKQQIRFWGSLGGSCMLLAIISLIVQLLVLFVGILLAFFFVNRDMNAISTE